MNEDFCLECGHMLPKQRTQSFFCGRMQNYDLRKDIMANFKKGNEYFYGYDPPHHLSFDQVVIG